MCTFQGLILLGFFVVNLLLTSWVPKGTINGLREMWLTPFVLI